MRGRVVEVRRYPVKSMGGEVVDAADVDRRGLTGDRLWALHDEQGRFGSGKTTRRFRAIPGLLDLSAAYDGDVPLVTVPGGATLRGDDPHTSARLSEHLGIAVTLTREGEVSHFDAGALHLCTRASLDRLQALLPASRVTVARFRPNLVLDSGEQEGFPEAAWVGLRLRIGDTLEVEVAQRTERCVMVSASQPGLPADRGVLRGVAAHHDLCLGVYADVVRPGRVGTGDAVTAVSAR